MSQLAEPASLYQSVLIYKHLRIRTPPRPPPRRCSPAWTTARRFSPSAAVEKGNVIMVALSAHVGWSNLPVRPIFLPMMARLVRAAGRRADPATEPWPACRWAVQLDDELRPVTVEVHTPRGATIQKEPADGGRGVKFTYPDTYDVGIYTLRLLDTARPSTIPYSANLDPDEADSKTIAPRRAGKDAGLRSAHFRRRPGGPAEHVPRSSARVKASGRLCLPACSSCWSSRP